MPFRNFVGGAALPVLLGVLLASGVRAGVILDDPFDDGNHATNSSGIGGPYNNDTWRAGQTETGGAYVITMTGDWANGGLVSYEDDGPGWDGSFDAWTGDGITATVLSGNAAVTNDTGEVIRAVFGIVNTTNKGDNQDDALVPHHNRQGGIWMRIVYTKTGSGDTDLAVSGRIVAAAADKSTDGTDPDEVDTLATFAIPEADWDGQGFRKFQLHVSDAGWQAYAQGTGVEWTDELVGGASAGNIYGQSWTTVNANASFTVDDPADDSDHLDTDVFADAVANVGINGSQARGTVRFDSWRVETGDALVPEPTTLAFLALGGLGLVYGHKRR
jgi:hypothetical protein